MTAEQTTPLTGHVHNRVTILNEPSTPLITECRDCGLAGSRAMWARLEALETLARQVAAYEDDPTEWDYHCPLCGADQSWGVRHKDTCPVTVARALLAASAATGGRTEP